MQMLSLVSSGASARLALAPHSSTVLCTILDTCCSNMQTDPSPHRGLCSAVVLQDEDSCEGKVARRLVGGVRAPGAKRG